MNILFISHCDFHGNSAMHIYSVANALTDLGVQCMICVPEGASTVTSHGLPKFIVTSYQEAYKKGVVFPDGKGPDLIHACRGGRMNPFPNWR